MEEENKKVENAETKSHNEELKEKVITVNSQTAIVFIAVVAMFLFVLCKILGNFGVSNPIFYGIISIVIYGLSLTGIIWSYLRVKKVSFEFWLNVIVFALAIVLI